MIHAVIHAANPAIKANSFFQHCWSFFVNLHVLRNVFRHKVFSVTLLVPAERCLWPFGVVFRMEHFLLEVFHKDALVPLLSFLRAFL
jgi:hypothetical protein